MLRLLGRGTFRIGGNTVDTMVLGHPYTLAQVEDLMWLARAVGWRVIYGLNLGANRPELAAAEARAVRSLARDRLLAFEIGNEPDLFSIHGLRSKSYDVSRFIEEFGEHRRAIERASPGAPVSGPGLGLLFDSPKWLPAFLERASAGLAFASLHFYPMVAKTPLPAGSPVAPTLANLLSERLSRGITKRFLAPAIEGARRRGLPFRLTETNTVARGGQVGVSDVPASAVWIVDWALRLAEAGAGGVNVQCDLIVASDIYTPLLEIGGHLTARPMFYGMLLVGQLKAGWLVRTHLTAPPGAAVTAYAVRGERVQVVVVNRERARAVRVRVEVPGAVRRAVSLLRLEGGALGGAAVASDGSWAPRWERVEARDGAWTVELAPVSAALLGMER